MFIIHFGGGVLGTGSPPPPSPRIGVWGGEPPPPSPIWGWGGGAPHPSPPLPQEVHTLLEQIFSNTFVGNFVGDFFSGKDLFGKCLFWQTCFWQSLFGKLFSANLCWQQLKHNHKHNEETRNQNSSPEGQNFDSEFPAPHA